MAARVRHQYPLRAGAYLAQVMCPPDMTVDEAFLLCEFVYSLVGKSQQEQTTQARAERRFFAETRPERAAAVKLWRVRFEVVTHHTRGHKPRTHMRCLLVAAAHEYAAMEEAQPMAVDLPLEGRIVSCRWLSTELVSLPVDLSDIETPATKRAGGRGYQAGYAAGLRDGFVLGKQESQMDGHLPRSQA